uniref:Sex-determining region Y protein n=1 Tax=Schmidtea mediterranea TaxID=79327 RepID=H9CXU9_SCHMD|nr:SOXP-2 [Schmidtea mediterranea]
MELNYSLNDNNFNLQLESESLTYFDLCQKCSAYQNSLRDWMKHLVDRHPLPIQWMSDLANNLTDDKLSKPYSTVTESRKKRKKHITPRPLNSFMIFSRHLRRNVLIFFSDASNSEISKLLGKLWNNIPATIKSMYDNEAKKLAILHSKEFPEYKYQPKKKKKQYLTKCPINSTPLSSNSYESIQDINSVTDTLQNSSNNLQKESNPTSVSSYGSNQECNNSFKNHSVQSSNFPKEINHKPSRKIEKQSCKISSNQIMDDSEGAESSPSSFKNTIKNEIYSSYSPFLNESHSILSDLSYSSSLNNVSKHTSDSIITNSPIREEIVLENNQPSQQNNINNYRHVFQRTSTLSNSLLTPLTIVTEKVDEQKDLPPSRINIRYVKINKLPIQTKSDFPLTGYFQNFNNDSNLHFQSSIHALNTTLTPDLSVKREATVNNSMTDYINRKRTNVDPLIIDDIFENEQFEDEEVLNFDNPDNNNSSPWSFKSPNFKISTGSSTLSDNPYKEQFCSSPFHLSETDTQPIPVQRLPAIGSWLKSNYSEFMI